MARAEHGTGGEQGPHSFLVAAFVWGSGSLTLCTVNDHLAYGLFRTVGGRERFMVMESELGSKGGTEQ